MKFFQDKKSTHKFSGVFRSRIQDENVTMPELALGYFLGPFCALLANAIFVSFLNRFYTDILGMKGLFITMLPLVSTVFVIIGNLKMGTMIDKTNTKAGKARP